MEVKAYNQYYDGTEKLIENLNPYIGNMVITWFLGTSPNISANIEVNVTDCGM